MIIIFWLAFGILLFTYLGYPVCLVLMSMFAPKSKVDESYLPSVSLIIPAYNEEKIIEKKINNSISLDYPKEKLEIVVASDGSTDNTKAIAKRYLEKSIKFLEFPRGGKLSALNQVVPKTKGEILVFTDASAMFNSDALRKMVRYFANGDIGAVTGVERIIREGSFISANESKYWNYETKVKEWESKIYSTVGANGPIYAIRRELFQPIPPDLNLCDDMVISLYVVQEKKKLVLDAEAIVLEHASTTLKEEWRRKVRISTQAWQTLRYVRSLLNPFSSPVAFPLLFHKVLRWLTLPLMLFMFLCNFFIDGTFYIVALILQMIFHSISVLGIILLYNNIRIPSMLTFLSYFLFTNLAQVVGLYNSIFNKGRPIWQPIERID